MDPNDFLILFMTFLPYRLYDRPRCKLRNLLDCTLQDSSDQHLTLVLLRCSLPVPTPLSWLLSCIISQYLLSPFLALIPPIHCHYQYHHLIMLLLLAFMLCIVTLSSQSDVPRSLPSSLMLSFAQPVACEAAMHATACAPSLSKVSSKPAVLHSSLTLSIVRNEDCTTTVW